jgi:hypothetical protein
VYRSLKPHLIVATAEALQRRIEERFPGSGLSKVSGEVLDVAGEAAKLSDSLSRPNVWLRLLAGLGVVAILAVVAGAVSAVDWRFTGTGLSELLQAMEAAINEVVFLGIAVYFLWSLEDRWKRARVLKALDALRSLAHIIDMHQLTKDPDRIVNAVTDTESSPWRALGARQLTRYLDYCSELLAILSKVAAVYVQRFSDPVTLAAVNEIEELATGLSRKIWQKIMILDRILAPELHPAVAPPLAADGSDERRIR